MEVAAVAGLVCFSGKIVETILNRTPALSLPLPLPVSYHIFFYGQTVLIDTCMRV